MQLAKKMILVLSGAFLLVALGYLGSHCQLALEQAEMANQRIDNIIEELHSKS